MSTFRLTQPFTHSLTSGALTHSLTHSLTHTRSQLTQLAHEHFMMVPLPDMAHAFWTSCAHGKAMAKVCALCLLRLFVCGVEEGEHGCL